MVDVDLTIKFCGVELRNPIAAASHAPAGPFTHKVICPDIYLKLIRKYYILGLGALVTGTITSYSGNLNWRGTNFFLPISVPGFAEKEGFVSAAKIPDVGFPKPIGIRVVERCKKEFKDMAIIASIAGPGGNIEGWLSLVKEVASAGADMLELNFGGPETFESVEKALKVLETRRNLFEIGGIILGLIPELAAEIVKFIVRSVNIPVIVKITPELGFFRVIQAARLYKDAGAKGLTCSHSFITVAPPDIYNKGKSTLPTIEGYPLSSFWATVGPWTRFAAYRDTAAVCKYVHNIDVFTCGGLVIPEHCIEAMMLGAKGVQLSAGIFWNGISFIRKVIDFMRKFLTEQGYCSVKEIVGLGLKDLVELGEVKFPKRIAKINYDKCVNCYICLDTWCFALEERNGKVFVNEELCRGCNLCVIRCPEKAIYLQYLES
ncbi:MAG: 4Fe-4S binding protein [Candidatus Bathyarchaeia archaeon]